MTAAASNGRRSSIALAFAAAFGLAAPLAERYKNHAGYVKEFRKAAEKLAKQRFLLAEDVQRYVDEAEASDVLR